MKALLATGLTTVSLLAMTSPAIANSNEDLVELAQQQTVAAAQAVETYATDNNGYYARASARKLRTIDPFLNEANLTVKSTATSYRVRVRSKARPRAAFTIARNSNGTVSRSCTPPGRGGCNTNGSWGANPNEGLAAVAKSNLIYALQAAASCGPSLAAIYDCEPFLVGVPLEFTLGGLGTYFSISLRTGSVPPVSFTVAQMNDGRTARTCSPAGAPGCRSDGGW